MTPRTFSNLVKGRNINYKDDLEREREIKYLLIAPNLAEKYKNKSVQELFPLSWDKPEDKKPKKSNKLSPEEVQKVLKGFKEKEKPQ